MRKLLLEDDSGQAVVEYVLAVGMVVLFVGILATGFRKIILGLWRSFAKEISAACPDCPADPNIR